MEIRSQAYEALHVARTGINSEGVGELNVAQKFKMGYKIYTIALRFLSMKGEGRLFLHSLTPSH